MKKNNRLAIIDLGTNTLKLLIAEIEGKRWNYMMDMAIPCRLGEGLKQSGNLMPHAQQRTLEALSEALLICKENEVNEIYPIATEAFRLAENGEEFRILIKQELALDFHIITGNEEAYLALYSLNNEFPASRDNSLIIDIGGGSAEVSAKFEVRSTNAEEKKEKQESTNEETEKTKYDQQNVFLSSARLEPQDAESLSPNFVLRTSNFELLKSLPLGCVVLTEEFLHQDPPTDDELISLRHHIQSLIRDLPVTDVPLSCFGIGGTLVTLASIHQRGYDAESIHASSLVLREIKDLSNIMNRMTIQQRKDLPGMILRREDVLPAGTIVLIELMEHFNVNSVTVSTHGIRHGFLQKVISNR